MLREDQKKETLREIKKLINHIHYMTTKFDVMIDQGKYYLQQVNQSKVLADLNIGYLLNYVF